jgi:hypothetical protein
MIEHSCQIMPAESRASIPLIVGHLHALEEWLWCVTQVQSSAPNHVEVHVPFFICFFPSSYLAESLTEILLSQLESVM